MASLKTIITVSVLKKIPQDILLRKLSHIRDELVSLNILSQDNAIKHQALAIICTSIARKTWKTSFARLR